jgi:hypothetical protein
LNKSSTSKLRWLSAELGAFSFREYRGYFTSEEEIKVKIGCEYINLRFYVGAEGFAPPNMPRIMKRNLSIPRLVTVVAALLGTSLLGLVGGLLAVAIAAAVLLIWMKWYFRKKITLDCLVLLTHT